MEGFIINNTGSKEPNATEIPPQEQILGKETIPTGNIPGLTPEELNDVNRIHITISDTTAPVIVLFGPASCGKTMTMVRLSRYLQGQGYQLIPDRSFRPSYDQNYKSLCDNFSRIVNSDDAASRTDNISFMLVKVIKDGRTICQILEGPGELYFDPNKATQNWPTYVHSLQIILDLEKYFYRSLNQILERKRPDEIMFAQSTNYCRTQINRNMFSYITRLTKHLS